MKADRGLNAFCPPGLKQIKSDRSHGPRRLFVMSVNYSRPCNAGCYKGGML